MRAKARHGTAGMYSNHGCRCDRCRKAWRDSTRHNTDRLRARYLSEGKNQVGKPRKRPYDQKAIDLMREHGFEPDSRFMP